MNKKNGGGGHPPPIQLPRFMHTSFVLQNRLFMIYKLMYNVYYSTNLSCCKIYEIKKSLAYASLLRYVKPKLSDPKYLSDGKLAQHLPP